MTLVMNTAAATCASCRQPLTGPYCAQCGEKQLDPSSLTVRHFVTHTVLDELGHLDGKLWRTVRSLMFRPGFLSCEYAAGRRRPYVNPVRLLLTAIVAYALLTQGGLIATLTLGRVILSIAPTAVPGGTSITETVRRIDRMGLLSGPLASKARATDISSAAVQERFHRRLNQFAQPLSLANVVLLALTLHVLFRRRRPLLVEHAAFSMHVVSFVLVSSLILVPAVRIVPTHLLGFVVLAVLSWQFAYLSAAIRRFYFSSGAPPARPRLYAVVAAAAIYLLNSAFITVVQMIGGAIALRGI